MGACPPAEATCRGEAPSSVGALTSAPYLQSTHVAHTENMVWLDCVAGLPDGTEGLCLQYTFCHGNQTRAILLGENKHLNPKASIMAKQFGLFR